MNRETCDAISQRAEVEFWYEGGMRTVEPHCHGTSRADNEVLRGFQVSGHSESGDPVAWKLFDVSKMSRFRKTGVTFRTNRPSYNPDDKHMKRVCCHV